jgi:hypothetical protein
MTEPHQPLLDAQRRAHRIACQLTKLQGMRNPASRRAHLLDVPSDIRAEVETAYRAWHAQQRGEQP